MASTLRAPLSSFCYCAAILLLGETLVHSAGHVDWIALLCAVAALVLVALPLLLPESVTRIDLDRRALDVLIAVGIAIGFCRLSLIHLVFEYPASRTLLMPFVVLCAVAGVLSILVLLGRPRSMVGGVFVLLLLDVGLMGWFFINLSAAPHIDVFVVQQLGCGELLHGRNPFSMTFPDIYGPGTGFYPATAVINGRVQSGYSYPPLSLLLDLPGFLAGDVRYSQLLALLLTAGLIGFSRRRFAPAVLFLFTPRLLFILENAWIESYALLMLGAIVWCRARRRGALVPIALGLFLVSKQYILLTVPAAAALLPMPWRSRAAARLGAIALLSGSAVTLPFILWNPAAFFHSMTSLYTAALRRDSISFLPIISRLLGVRLTLLCPLLAAVPPGLLILFRSPRTACGFASAVALICLCVFVFSTQAFLNYYFLALGALCAAIGSEGTGMEASPDVAGRGRQENGA